MLVFIDDSGDSGFKISKGASTHFVIALVIFKDPLEAEKTALGIKVLRRSLGFADTQEFKFFKSRNDIKIRFLKRVAVRDFTVRAIVVDKEKVRSVEMRNDKRSFYSFFIRTALKRGEAEVRNAKVWIDGIGDRGFRREFMSYLRRELDSGAGVRPYRSIRFVDSKDNVLIQLADMIAGAVLRKYAKRDAAYHALIADKITEEWVMR